MARESLSGEVKYEKHDYGVEIFRERTDSSVKITNKEMKLLGELSER